MEILSWKKTCVLLTVFGLIGTIWTIYQMESTTLDDLDIVKASEKYINSVIHYNEKELRQEIEFIHDSNYKIKDGDTCKPSVPDSIIVGVAKCGTRELIDFMSIHPNIVSKHDPYALPGSAFENPKLIKRKMPCKYSDQISILKAHGFLTDKSMPDVLYKLNPNMKIIAIIREPVSRVLSLLSFVKYDQWKNSEAMFEKLQKDKLEKAVSIIDNLETQTEHHRAVTQSLYDVGLIRYLEKFGRDNVLVIESNEFKKDPVDVVRRVEDFFGIRRFVSNKHYSLNPTKGFYCIRKTLGSPPPQSMVCYEANRGRKASIELSIESQEKLRAHFKPHNENLFRILGKRYDGKHWQCAVLVYARNFRAVCKG